MVRFPSLHGHISIPAYAAAAPALILAQHLLTALVYRIHGELLIADQGFWLLPLRRLANLGEISAWEAGLFFVAALILSWTLAVLSFRRAERSRQGFGLAALSLVPALQILAVLALTVMPIRGREPEDEEEPSGSGIAHVVQGVLVGAAIIVFAVLASAVTFGAYGWGLFVLTPFLAGAITAYVANRRAPINGGTSLGLAMGSALLGGLMLLMLALEGAVCIILLVPLALPLVMLGAVLGRQAAIARLGGDTPLKCVALLPIVFALEAAMPPSLPILTEQSIVIEASPREVWNILTTAGEISSEPGLPGRAGLAYPTRSEILEGRVGGVRIGHFSTGTARERITQWSPGHALAFTVTTQPPAMEEMSPYRRVNAPHLQGYFDTRGTRFELAQLSGGRTRLTIRASHVLRIDPVLYWEPLARWATATNSRRVLADIKSKAEASGG